MRRIYVILLSVIFFAACYKEDVDRLFSEQSQLEALIRELREYCKQTNEQVEFLKTLINGSMIKEVKSFEETETGRSGWEIFFTDGTSFRVYNGLDGSAPEISTVQEGDGWYWTLNGEKLTDGDGNPLRVNGKDGTTPTISPDGYWMIGGVVTGIQASGNTPKVEINADGYWMIDGVVTPVRAVVEEPVVAVGAELIDGGILKDKTGTVVENTAWYLSVDGENWVRISGKDGGNGGGNGPTGNGLIESVTITPDGMTVIILLSNGQEIRVPSWAWAESLTERVNGLVTTLNTWITQAKYITEVTSLEEDNGKTTGWRIHYSDNTFSDVYNGKDGTDGKEGSMPDISVIKEGDEYFWTLNGEKLLVDGQPVKASAVKPGIRLGEELEGKTDTEGNPVEAGIWYFSVDGEAWTRITGARGETGPKGDAFFQKAPEIDPEKGSVVFTLQDGTRIEVALYDWVKSKFDAVNTEFANIRTLLEELKARKYISKVEEVMSEDGTYVRQYRVVFSDNTEILLGNTMIGIRAATPADGGEQDDLYWTVNGTDLLYNGRPVKANAQDALGAPQVKTGRELIDMHVTTAVGGEAVVASANYLSVDGGSQWVRLTGDQGLQGNKGDQGDPGQDGIIIGVEPSDDGYFVTFKLGNGGEDIVLATYKWMETLYTTLSVLTDKLTTIQTLLQGNYLIKSITEVKDESGGVIGYDLECRNASNGRVRILQIRNGEKGVPGLAPVISIEKGDDGDYYWVVNGEVMKDDAGNPIPVNGAAGVPGENAPVPRLELGSNLTGVAVDAQGNPIDGYAVYLSVDNGLKWTKVSGPEGAPGTDGNPGDAFFDDVSLSEDGYWVTLKLKGTAEEIVIPTQKWMDKIAREIQQTNDRIDAIDRLLNQGILITSITPFDEGGKTGYELAYTEKGTAKSVKVYNGTSPVISLRKDETDGNYYWTRDGEYLTDTNGNRIRANGTDGQNGTGGSQGDPGQDAPLPQLKSGQELENAGVAVDAAGNKIDVSAVYLSVDGGKEWTRVSGEKGDSGEAGTPGSPADPGFLAELSADGYWLDCTFSDGSTLKIPTQQWADEVKGKLDDLNTSVENLKQLLQNALFIKEIKAFTEGGRSGWEIVCMDLEGQQLSPSYKIYNGEQGDTGPQGTTPGIGMATDPDKPGEDVLYWTLDGELMTGPDGKYIPVTGKDAPAPRVQAGASLMDKVSQDAEGQTILTTAYYLSVDGGTSWYKVSGDKGDRGDSFIESIDTDSSDEYVIFKMADGTEFKVAKYIEIRVTFENTGGTFSIGKNTSRAVNFTVSGSYAKNLSLTTVVGGNWKVLQQYDGAAGRGSLTIQAPGEWDHNKVVLLLADQKGRVWTSSLTVETSWTAGDPFVDSRDERTYQIRRFADNKLWMTEDLKYGKASGYTYDELSDGLCPDGWRLPVNDDWQGLNDKFETEFGSASVGGGWWSFTVPEADGTVSIWQINYPGLSSEQVGKTIPRSVRCVKDDASSPYR